jgi:protein-S-isoprenylcysteine O-methyltransferase Ste14
MSLDIRTPIGLMFGIIGLILVVFGFFSDPKIYERSLGINVNLGWGCVLLAFAAFMLILAWRAKHQPKKDDNSPSK